MNLNVMCACAFLLGICGATHGQAASPAALAGEILDAAGVTGGFVVQVNCGDGQLTAALGGRKGFIVQGLDTDPANVARARDAIRAGGDYGRVSADRWDGKTLPYINNFVNLVVADAASAPPMEEMMRVLTPNGVAYVRSGAKWTKTVKPWPQAFDEWTHYLYDASNNAVGHDTAVAPPRRMQWTGGPAYSRHHDRMSSVSAAVTSGGRFFYIFDEAPPISILLPSEWKLIARDAFNGTVLWKRDIADWEDQLQPLKDGPAQLPRRLVAEKDRVYVTLGLDAPITALDAVTGETVTTYAGSNSTEEFIYTDGLILAMVNDAHAEAAARGERKPLFLQVWDEAPRTIKAFDAKTGKQLWGKRTPVMPGALAANGKIAVYHDGDKVNCVDVRTGEERWHSEAIARGAKIESYYLPILVLYDDVVLFSGGETASSQTGSWYESGKDTMTALAADTGKLLWNAYHPPSGYKSPEDLLVVNGLVWTGETTSGRAEGLFSGRDVHSGEVMKEFSPDVDTYWFHHRCYRGKATGNYLLMSRTGIEFLDVNNSDWDVNHWVRGACLYGIMPANGLVYAPQHPCACYQEAKLTGLNALAPALEGVRVPNEIPAAARLEKGPAYGQADAAAIGVEEWPTYRHDPARSGNATTRVPVGLNPSWKVKLGGHLSSPVIADGKLFVADIDAHTVYALDAVTGAEAWHFTAGARVDSPPTIHKGLALFGATDGYLYAVRVSDGALAWRFLAAPMDQRAMWFEQIESVWPLHGSVLIYDDVLFCAAGRSMFLDSGLRLWRLNPVTGEVLSENVLDEHDLATGKDIQDFVSWLNMPPALNDILSCDGDYMYMRSQPYELNGTRLPLEAKAMGPDLDQGAPMPTQNAAYSHLFSPTGFLDDTNWHRTYWMYGSNFVSGWQGYFRAGKVTPAGRVLVFDDENVYGFGRLPQYYRWTVPIEHQLYSAKKSFINPDPEARMRPSELYVENSASLNPAGNAITVEAWVNCNKPDGVVVSHGDQQQGYALYIEDGRPHFVIRKDGQLSGALGDIKITGRWAHVAGVLTESGDIEVYVDGEKMASTSHPGLTLGTPTEALVIGADAGGTVGDYTAPFAISGTLDEVKVYRHALKAPEISEIAKQQKAQAPGQDLMIAFSFDSGKAEDESGNGNEVFADAAQAGGGKIGKGMRFNGGGPPNPEFTVEQHWTEPLPIFARALVLSEGMLFVAGPPDVVDEEQAFRSFAKPETQRELSEQAASYAGEDGAQLVVVSTDGGKEQARYDLDSPPVFDGLAAANGRLYMASVDGTVVCMGGQ